jgi:hypothetical protein
VPAPTSSRKSSTSGRKSSKKKGRPAGSRKK